MTLEEAKAALHGVKVELIRIGAKAELPWGVFRHVAGALRELGAATKAIPNRKLEISKKGAR